MEISDDLGLALGLYPLLGVRISEAGCGLGPGCLSKFDKKANTTEIHFDSMGFDAHSLQMIKVAKAVQG